MCKPSPPAQSFPPRGTALLPDVAQLVGGVEGGGEALQRVHVVGPLHLVHQEPHLDLGSRHTLNIYINIYIYIQGI